uniref:Protein cornichon homolog 4 n=1 Tax=Urocitellus parryii TaxID=9999 RepID=A0A8D2KND5_UROPR
MEAVVFVFSLLDCCALIFLSVYFIITLSDLECDYINARSCCSKLNKWVIPELIGHTVVTVLMLVSLHWFIFLLNLPVATWNIYRFIMVPSGNMGVVPCVPHQMGLHIKVNGRNRPFGIQWDWIWSLKRNRGLHPRKSRQSNPEIEMAEFKLARLRISMDAETWSWALTVNIDCGETHEV